MSPDHNPSIAPVNDGPGNGAYRDMRALLAEVTQRERKGQG
jgi:hypothetical protein